MADKALVVEMRDVTLCQEENVIFQNLNLSLSAGDFVYLIGSVGSGKSTLLKALYAEVPISAGYARVIDYDLVKLKRKHLPYLRRKLGIVFQDFQLLNGRTVAENLDFVLRATDWKNRADREQRIEEVLTRVGMTRKAYKRPHELSGGEQQRVGIARALLAKPALILADEPTGNLDSETGLQIACLLYEISKQGTAVLMSTHNSSLLSDLPARTLAVRKNGDASSLVELVADAAASRKNTEID
ncbi:phosphonate ABC transporter ATP-binding protein [Porphyromonas gulae]|uniref:cell division ATP-binding protein FtsE n=1 Tax=Porphyromonas gulae TaxID=111105 RepID=UPI00036D800C|nr:ATP-binding cassette domain-containing protein [Porphyromonas gulae]KGN69672.1 phosphonate ABC transporter ATP-binding protein [Porphyromonas gulae]KGN77107.1 phosphonate ABC transporter ATP-binding protein [Porphyromonas gulae]KGO02041.1 phosphonate ABC transporter ATP-binding protein [Porphyromonas gulae]KKC50355.1 phosphonate ABC transporter ATP-binding protein [Porphyromonas gulae]